MLLLAAQAASATRPTFPAPVAHVNFQACTSGTYTGPGAYGGVGCSGGKFRHSGTFDGVDDGVALPDQAAYHMTDSLTLSAWVRPDTVAGGQAIVSKWYSPDSYRLSLVDGKWRFVVAFPGGTWGTTVTVEAPATAGTWTHVAGVYDGASALLYVNGELAADAPASGTLQQSTMPLQIGNHPSGAALDGRLDEVRLYTEALTSLQVKELASMVPWPFTGSPSSARDLDVTHLRRTPRIDYDASPNVPQDGSTVTWHAHLRNRGSQSLSNVIYHWYVDGVRTKTGVLGSLAAGASAQLTYDWTWDSGDHYVAFVADPYDKSSETSEKNNYRLVRTNALMIGVWVEQSVRDFFDQNQYAYQASFGIGDEANSWEDWAQRQMDQWNEMLAGAITEATPEGGHDRVRLDQVIVVADGSLPSSGGLPTNHPDTSDKTVDMMWGFPSPVDPDFYDVANGNSAFHLEPSLVHELHHARYLVDSYGLNIHGKHIDVTDAAGQRIFPDDDSLVRPSSAAGCMMESSAWCYAEWEIAWMNQFARQRPLPGWANYNAHYGLEQHMTLVNAHPWNNRLLVLDSNGQPLVGAEVRIYRGDEWTGPWHWYAKHIDDTADQVSTVPSNGYVSLGSNPFSQNPIHGGNFYRCVNFIKVVHGGQESYHWFDLPQMHVSWFRGQTRFANYTLYTTIDTASPSAP